MAGNQHPFETIIRHNRQWLVESLRDSVREALSQLPDAVRDAPREPELVAALHLWAIPNISRKWSAILGRAGMHVRLLGRFCHGGPFAHYDRMRKEKCELGDLLIVHMHTDSVGQEWNNALLLQAKMVTKYPHAIRGKGDFDQLQLLENWPLFRYVKSGPELNDQVRNVLPKVAHLGAQYLGIDWRGEPLGAGSGIRFSLDVCPARAPITPTMDFGLGVVDVLTGDQGRRFWRAGAPPQDAGWSQVVWDLIRKTVTTPFHSSRVLGGGLPRGFTDENFEELDIPLYYPTWEEYFEANGVTTPRGPDRASSSDTDDDLGGPALMVVRSSMLPQSNSG